MRPVWKFQSFSGRPRIRVGKRFSLQGALLTSGQGQIVFGDDVIVDASTALYTHSPEALIEVGHRSYLNGVRMGCFSLIQIGEDVLLADARIMDTDFHAVSRRRTEGTQVIAHSPIRVENNVWIAGGSAVLKGVRVGQNAVIAFGSVVTKSVPPGRIFGGNPARDLGPVPD